MIDKMDFPFATSPISADFRSAWADSISNRPITLDILWHAFAGLRWHDVDVVRNRWDHLTKKQEKARRAAVAVESDRWLDYGISSDDVDLLCGSDIWIDSATDLIFNRVLSSLDHAMQGVQTRMDCHSEISPASFPHLLAATIAIVVHPVNQRIAVQWCASALPDADDARSSAGLRMYEVSSKSLWCMLVLASFDLYSGSPYALGGPSHGCQDAGRFGRFFEPHARRIADSLPQPDRVQPSFRKNARVSFSCGDPEKSAAA